MRNVENLLSQDGMRIIKNPIASRGPLMYSTAKHSAPNITARKEIRNEEALSLAPTDFFP